MPGDFDHVLLSVRCSACSRSVSSPLAEIRVTGIVACICGAITRAIYDHPVEKTPFSSEGWHEPDGTFDQLNGWGG